MGDRPRGMYLTAHIIRESLVFIITSCLPDVRRTCEPLCMICGSMLMRSLLFSTLLACRLNHTRTFHPYLHTYLDRLFCEWDIRLTRCVQKYQKDAIYRQMREYKREKETLESQLRDVQRRSIDHDDHLRIIDAWWTQVFCICA